MNTVQAFKKAKFVALLLLCFSAFIYAFGRSISKLTSGETSVEMEFQSTREATFPALTICPHYNVAYKANILAALGSSPTQMRNGIYPNNFTGSSLDFFLNVTHEFREIVQEIYFSTLKSLPGTDFRYFIFTTDDLSGYKKNPIKRLTVFDKSMVQEQFYTSFGRCYSMILPQEVQELEVTSITMTLRMEAYVFPHHPGQYLHRDTKDKLPVELGRYFFIATNHKIVANVEKPIESVAEDKASHTCYSNLTFNYDTCIYDHVNILMSSKFGCIAPFFPKTTSSSYEICQIQNFSEAEAKEFMSYYKSAFQEDVRVMDCISPCSTMIINTGYPFTDEYFDATKARLRLYFRTFIQVQTSKFAYDSVNFLGEVGGNVGLWLGFSILSLDSILNWLIDLYVQRHKKQGKFKPKHRDNNHFQMFMLNQTVR